MQIRSYNRLIIYGAVIIIVSFILALLLVPYLSSIDSFADPLTSLETSISISSSEAALLHMYPDSFGTTSQTINVSTNNSTGYTLLFSTNSNSTDLVNVSDDSLTIPTISLRDGESSQTKDTFTSGYGYSTDNTNYIPVPGFTTDGNASVALADVIGQTDIAGDGTAQLSFGVKIPADASTGVYQNRFQISAIANDVSYEIKFNSNVENETVTNLPETSIGTFNGDGIYLTLSDQIPNRYPYTFLGWSEDQVLTDDSVLYQPGDSILLDPTKANSFNLYAQWEFRCHPNATTISNSQDTTILSDAICMQDMNLTVAKSMPDEVQYTLYDKRDQKPYFIAMLKDGNVWMTQNLDLGDAEKSYTLTSDDTDLEEGQTFVLPAYSDPEAIPFDTEIYEQEQRIISTAPTIKDGGDNYYVPIRSPISTVIYEDLESCLDNYDIDTCRHYSAGNYYNDYAATAGFIPDTAIIVDKVTSPSSICPANWRLSSATGEKSFQNLIKNKYGGIFSTTSSATTIMASSAPFYYNQVGYYYTSITRQDESENSYIYEPSISDNIVELFTDSFSRGGLFVNYFGGTTLSWTSVSSRNEATIRCIARDNATSNLTINYHFKDETTPTKTEVFIYDSEDPNSSHLDSVEPVRDGYVFSGWGITDDATEPVYQPGDKISYSTKATPTSDQTIDLYAIWQESSNLLTTISTMQEMTPEICNGTTTPTTTYGAPSVQLTDTRDGKKYWVSKLADGRCWMTQNLDLGDEDIAYTLTSEDSDVANDYLLPAESAIDKQPVIEESIYISPSYYAIVNGTLIADYSTCLEEYDENTCTHNSVGKYYNYYTTTAGTVGASTVSDNVPDSICPLGWKIPGAAEFQKIVTNYNLSSQPSLAFNAPLSFVQAGYYINDYSNLGNSATLQTRNNTYLIAGHEMHFTDTFANATNYVSVKSSDRSIRCVARDNESYTLSFNNNGGSGSPSALTSSVTNTGHYTYNIPLITPTRSGYTFAGWNSLADGTGITVQPGDNYSVSESSTLYATWNYALSYDANGGTDTPNSQTKIGGSTTFFEISPIVPTNSDKLFLGWSTDPNGNSPLYLNGKIRVTSPNTTLYAIWKDSESGLATIDTMQEMDGAICEATPIHYSKQLTDTRDGKKYWVAKLADGNCWMTQNLDLGSKETAYTLTPEDSDVSEDFTLPIEDTSLSFASENTDAINFRSSENIYITQRDPDMYSVISARWNSMEECIENTGLSAEECQHYHTGAYYNWYTATAGTGTTKSIQYDIAASSICPTGWRLPLGRSSASSLISEYSNLLFSEDVQPSASNSTNVIYYSYKQQLVNFESSPLYFTRFGYKSNYSTLSLNSHTLNWESTARSSVAADALYSIFGQYFSPQYSVGKHLGATVRCIARSNETYTLSYNANGGENVPISQTSAVTNTGHYNFTLSSSVPTRSGYTFAGWNTKADGTGEMYQPSAEFIAHGSTTLYATWNYTLSYDANGGSNAPESITKAGGETTEFIIDRNEPTKENSYFWGWSLSSDSESGEYAPLDRISVNTPETTLYAIWNDSEVPLETITYMQDINSDICRETPNGYSKQLIDKRDGKSYWVTKYADGNCWMSQNLDIGDTERDYLLTPEDSDVKEDFLLTKKDYSVIISSTEKNIVKYNDGENFITADKDNSLHMYATAEDCAVSEDDLDKETCKHYHSGNQYNYYTATAGSMTTEDYANTEADSSICPRGWRLPTMYNPATRNSKSFTNLLNVSYGITNSDDGSLLTQKPPLYYTRIYTTSEMVVFTTGTGAYATSTAASLTNGRNFWVEKSRVLFEDSTNKTYGFNIRCVARNTPVNYNITYNYQDGSTPSETKTLSFDGETRSLMIDTEAPEREGYNFVGWGTSASDTTPSYMPGDLFNDFYTNSNMPTTSQSLELYAIWEESTNLLSTISTMQEMTPEICNGTTTPTTTYGAPSALLTDTRDGKKYWVAKLADGKCWMTQNLDLGDKEDSYTLTPEDSDVTTEFALPKEPTTTEFSTSTYNTVNFRNNDVYAVTSRLNDWDDYIYKSKSECEAVYGEDNSFCQHYYVGGYYNWYTATAGNGVQENITDYDHINTSICPAGWRLPYGKADNNTPSEFSTLLYNYGIISSAATSTGNVGFTTNGMDKIRLSPLHFVRAGYYNGTAISYLQFRAYYSESHNNNSQYLYSLYFANGSIQPNSKNSKYSGFNLRCVARESDTYTLYYDANGGNNAPISQSKTSATGHVEMIINSIAPVRPGYTFKGYSHNKYSDTADYDPGDTVTFAEKRFGLYAIWEKTLSCHPNATSIGDIDSDADIADDSKAICMQDMNTTVAKSMTEEEQYRLIDVRDNTTYFVARLKDGNVWMTQNLDLGNSATSYTLTPSDSDVKENFTLPTPTDLAFVAAHIDLINYRDPGDVFYITSGNTNADTAFNSLDECANLGGNYNNSNCYHYHAGNYYNWYTATAGTGTSNMINNYETTDSSICPAGWKLPQGLTTTTVSSNYPALLFEYGVVNGTTIPVGNGNNGYKANGLNTIRSAPLYFIRAGYYNNATLTYPKTDGLYWSSSNWDTTNGLSLHFFNTNIRTNYYSSAKASGRSIRCLARNTAVDYTINYHENDGTDTVTSETVSYSGNGLELKVKAETPTREGYIFLGWGTSASDTTPSYVSGQLFEQSSITDMITENQTLDLYAIWEASATNLLTTISTMQEMTPAICEGTTTPATNYGAPSAQLTDTRDGKKYWVSKLADGQCWMTQNLDLGSKDVSYTLTPQDSDVTENFTLSQEDATIPFNTFNYDVVNFRDPGEFYQTPSNKTTTDTDWPFYAKERCESVYNDAAYCEHHHAGNYYNWYTATAGAGDYNYLNNLDTLSSSICPAGWRLPKITNTSTGNTDFAQLLSHNITTVLYKGTGAAAYATDGFRTIRNSAFSATRSGFYNNAAISNIGANGYYWTSTTNSTANAYGLYFINTAPYPNYSLPKYQGRTVRCIARTEESYTLTYNANGGTDAPISQTSGPTTLGHVTFTLSSLTPSRNDFTFVGWNTRADGSGRMYQPSDKYASGGSTTLYAIWSYTLNYDANGGDNTPQSVTVNDGTSHVFSIDEVIPTKAGSLFIGWSEDPNATVGTYYAEGVLTSNKPITTLYAIWGSSIALDSINTMQEMTSSICANTPIGYTKQLEDIRDNTTYFVAKLGDGRCWMTQNLDFAPDPARTYYGDDGNTEHTPDTDIGFGTSDANNTWVPTGISTTAPLTTANANLYIYRSLDGQYYIPSGTVANDVSYTSKASCEAANDPDTCTHYQAGNYYNWYTAVAGSGVYGTGSGANYTSAANSICPYGWRLPLGRTSSTGISEFGDLMIAHDAIKTVPANNNALSITIDGFNTMRKNPLYYTRAGYFYNSNNLSNGGAYILLWTSTNASNANAYGFFSANFSAATPNSSQGKHQAFNIRCVAR